MRKESQGQNITSAYSAENGLEIACCRKSSVPVHNAYIDQLKFLAVVCAQTMPKKSKKIYVGTYLFPGANNSEENREKSIFVSLKL